MPIDTNSKTVLINITYASRTLNWFTNFDIGSNPEVVHQLCEQFFGSVERFQDYEINPQQGYRRWSLIGLNENKNRAEAGNTPCISR